MQDNSQQTFVNPPPPEQVPTPPLMPDPAPKPKPGKTNLIWIIAGGVVVCGIFACLAYFAGANQNAGKQNSTSQTPAATQPGNPAQTTTPAVTTPASTPAAQIPAPATTPATTPAASTPTPTPTPSAPPAATPEPASAQPTLPPISAIDSSTIITKQAYQMVLTLSDMGTGWAQSSAAAPSRGQSYSSSHVNFSQGSSYSPVVQNIVVVYRTIQAAENSYNAEKPVNLTSVNLSHPAIGDECFYNNSVPNNKVLVFRKNNVVSWITIQQDKNSDPTYYAQIVERRIYP